ncbi:unnamed protein product [marine sediment metagenome]|jgi:hypothetical protein|uniref:Uncharacterized protein n=1 Tax=marine sediment metagenome TaxID=412755 RepID=X1VKM5_9ZZZZ
MALLLPVLKGLVNVMEIVTFIQFIEEEAIQSAALGVFLAIRAKSYRGASLGITLLRGQLIPHLRDINEYVGWLAPYSQGCFADFVLATETNLEIYEDILFAKKK